MTDTPSPTPRPDEPEEHEEVVTRVLAVLAQAAGRRVEDLRPEHELVADLGLDSAAALRLLVDLEEALDVEIDDEDAARLATVGDVLDFCRDRRVRP